MQLSDLNSKLHGRKSLSYIINGTIGVYFVPKPGSEHYKLLLLNRLHESNNINNNHSKNDNIKVT